MGSRNNIGDGDVVSIKQKRNWASEKLNYLPKCSNYLQLPTKKVDLNNNFILAHDFVSGVKTCWNLGCVLEIVPWLMYSLGFNRFLPRIVHRHVLFPWKLKVKSLSRVWPFMIPVTVGSVIHGVFQARVLEWVAISFPQMKISLCFYLNYSPCLKQFSILKNNPTKSFNKCSLNMK